MGEGDGDVGEDDGGVGVDRGDDDGLRQHSGATGSEGREPPFFFFFLDLLPRWEKGFPSGPWPPWHGRGESPFEIGSISLFLSGSAFCSGSVSPFRIYMEIRNSDWPETFAVIFFSNISFLAAKEGLRPPYRVATRVRGAPDPLGRAPCLMAPSGIVSR